MNQQKNEIADFFTNLKEKGSDVYLYFVTRHIKEGLKNKKVLEKYNFRVQKVDLSFELQGYFKEVLIKQLDNVLSKDDLEITDYKIISDDLKNTLYTYALNNALSFSKIFQDQLVNPTSIDNVQSLKEIKGNLWAYCIRISIDSENYYSFRKISEGKVATGDSQSKKEKLLSYFDSNDLDLKQLKSEVISFDDRVDCIYINEKFFVFSKGNFETILGLEEEYKENAEDVITTLEKTNLIEGIDLIKESSKINKNLLKTLASIAKKQNHSSFNVNEIDKMKKVLKRMENKDLKVTQENKIKLEDNSDLQGFLKLLNDFYKQGLVTEKYYGTNSGAIIHPTNT